jgi:hypothetical protein
VNFSEQPNDWVSMAVQREADGDGCGCAVLPSRGRDNDSFARESNDRCWPPLALTRS